MEAIFGLTHKQEFTFQDWINLIYPADQERMLEAKQAINPEQEMIPEYRIVLPDGQVRWVRSHVRMAEGSAGQPQNPKRGGVCNPAVYVLCEVTASDMAQNVSDGIQYPVRL